jgi:uncharacterized membrane protein
MTTPNATRGPAPHFFSSTIVRGLLVVLPIWLSAFVVLKVLDFLRSLLKPVASLLPDNAQFQNLVALVLVVVLCFAIGLMSRSDWGGRVIGWAERSFLLLPGYRSLRTFIHSLLGSPVAEGWTPALIRTDETEQPGFVIERHDDGRFTVFVPGAPTPMSGDVHVIDGWRVKMVSAGTPEILRVLARFGAGAERVKQSASAPQGTPPKE